MGNKDAPIKVVVVGMANSGKTTILYKLSLGEVVITQPTIGSNIEEVEHSNIKLQVWDLGGQENLRSHWDAYYQNTHAVIFVVDSADDSQMMTSKAEFFNLLVNNDLSDCSILIFANKQDLPMAKNQAELTDAYSLHEIQNHNWKIQGCCALTGEGLDEGLDWLTN